MARLRLVRPTPEVRAQHHESWVREQRVLRERLRRAFGEPPQMPDAEFEAETAWAEGFGRDELAAWRRAHGLEDPRLA